MLNTIYKINQLSDRDLKTVAEQVVRFDEVKATGEKFLTDLIENYEGGSEQGMQIVPKAIMIECTKRWCNLITT